MAIPGVPLFGPLAAGDQPLTLFDTAFNAVQAYILANINPANMTNEGPFTASGGQFVPGTTTQLTLSQSYGSLANLWVTFDGVWQGYDTMSLSGAILTFNNPIPVGTGEVYIKGGVVGVAVASTIPYGVTANRPTITQPGQLYLDTTIGYQITSLTVSPPVWVNAAGVAV